MKVKIGNRFIDSHDEPIMLILGTEEKRLISEMGEQTKFLSFPDDYKATNILEFMKNEKQIQDEYFKNTQDPKYHNDGDSPYGGRCESQDEYFGRK